MTVARRRNRMVLSAAGATGCDANFASVSELYDWEQSDTPSSNTNFGSAGSPTYTGWSISSSPAIQGTRSLITTGTTNSVNMGVWDMATNDWTIDFLARFNGVVFPLVTDLVDHDLVTNYNATTNNRSFFAALRGLGGSTHGIRFVFSENGTSNNVISDVDLGVALVADTNYDIAFERDGANVNLYLDGTFINNVALPGGAAYDFFTTGLAWHYGLRHSGGATIASGRVDEFRFTRGVARFGGSNYTPVVPRPQIAC